jgi:hypothetical protein
MKSLLSIFGSLLLAVSLQAGIINVPADQPTIQAGINAAANGDTVLVADGTYIENINYLGKAITVASHYLMDSDTAHIANTIIDGSQPSNPDSGSVVTFESGEDTTSVLSGFTITGGSGTITEATYQGVVYPRRSGGGILCYESGARISANVIMNNNVPVFTASTGGGICVLALNSGAYARIDGNKIISNVVNGGGAWGIGVELNGNGTITNNIISFNTSNATNDAYGAINCWADSTPGFVLIKDNHITHNEVNGNDALAGGIMIEDGIIASVIGNDVSYNVLNGTHGSNCGGIYVLRSTDAILIDGNTVTNNRVNSNNISWGGGISLWADDPATNTNILITNNIVSGNQAKEGAGIYSRLSDAQIINNTITNNTATIRGGGILVRESSAQDTVINTILWGNAPSNSQISLVSGGVITVRYSDIEGGWPGEGNINADPLLVADSLADASPCIGKGIFEYDFGGGVVLYSPLYDINGRMRPYPPTSNYPDMGAWESKLGIPVGIEPEPGADIPKTYALHQNYPNPFNPGTTIEFALAKPGWVTLKIYNILGQEVAELISENLSAGSYKYNWNSRLTGMASGVYYYRIEAGQFSQTKKMLFIR